MTLVNISKKKSLIIIVMRRRIRFLWTICCWIDFLSEQSRKNNCENLTILRDEIKTENFKKIKKKFSEFFSLRSEMCNRFKKGTDYD